MPGQDSSESIPVFTTKTYVASLHRCQGKTLHGPFHHPPGKPVWQVYTDARARLFRALSTIHQETLCGKSREMCNGRRREDRELLSWSKSPAVPTPSSRDESTISKIHALHRSALTGLGCHAVPRVRDETRYWRIHREEACRSTDIRRPLMDVLFCMSSLHHGAPQSAERPTPGTRTTSQ